jgi:hypothetical protein
VLQRRCPTLPWRLSQLLRLLWLQLRHWQQLQPGRPLWHRLLFRWLWLKQLLRLPLHLQRRRQYWPHPRWMALFHQLLWQPLAQLWRQQSLLRLWQRHQLLLLGQRPAWLRRRSTALALPDCPVLQRRCPKLPWPLSLQLRRLWLPLRQWRQLQPGQPLWRQSRLRWQWLPQLRLYPLRLHWWLQHWQSPRYQAQFHRPLWRQLARLSLPLLRLQLWLPHQRQRQVLRFA